MARFELARQGLDSWPQQVGDRVVEAGQVNPNPGSQKHYVAHEGLVLKGGPERPVLTPLHPWPQCLHETISMLMCAVTSPSRYAARFMFSHLRSHVKMCRGRSMRSQMCSQVDSVVCKQKRETPRAASLAVLQFAHCERTLSMLMPCACCSAKPGSCYQWQAGRKKTARYSDIEQPFDFCMTLSTKRNRQMY